MFRPVLGDKIKQKHTSNIWMEDLSKQEERKKERSHSTQTHEEQEPGRSGR